MGDIKPIGKRIVMQYKSMRNDLAQVELTFFRQNNFKLVIEPVEAVGKVEMRGFWVQDKAGALMKFAENHVRVSEIFFKSISSNLVKKVAKDSLLLLRDTLYLNVYGVWCKSLTMPGQYGIKHC